MQLVRLFASLALLALAGCSTVTSSTVPTGSDGATHSVHSIGQTATGVVPAELLNHEVRQDTIDMTICMPGYTASVRPSTSFTNGVKAKLVREAGLPGEATSDYVLDHHVPLAVGGHPRNLRNLVLQKWEGAGGAKQKDRLEKRLQALVCSRQLSLVDAQWAIYADWQAAYARYVKT